MTFVLCVLLIHITVNVSVVYHLSNRSSDQAQSCSRQTDLTQSEKYPLFAGPLQRDCQEWRSRSNRHVTSSQLHLSKNSGLVSS